MPEISEFPYAKVEFDKEGHVHDENQVNELEQMLDARKTTDLIVLSHGWNNNMDEALEFYSTLLSNLRAAIGTPPNTGNRQLAVLGVMWPSKKFTEAELIASGAAGVGGVPGSVDLDAHLDVLVGGFDADAADAHLEEMKGLARALELQGTARTRFVELARKLLIAGDTDDEISEELGPGLLDGEPDDILEQLGSPDLLSIWSADNEDGGAAAFGLSGIRAGAQRLLNLLTFFQMKARAGLIGEAGVRGILERVRADRPDLRLHLIGHSFGGRLVTAAVRGRDGAERLEVDSLVLLQAAFSHHGLAHRYNGAQDGHFRCVVADKRVRGPIVITHTRNDRAVGLAYPLASRLRGQDAAQLGGPGSRFGGMGSNGAQHTPEATSASMRAAGSAYDLEPGSVVNLLGDQYISDHGDVANEHVASLVLTAVLAT